MPYFSGPNGIREVADPGERFLQSFQDSRKKRLLSDYFANGQTDLGQLAKYDPEAAQQIQAQQKQQGLAKMFADLYAAPEAERPKGIAALLGADLETGQKAMKAFDPRFRQDEVSAGQRQFEALIAGFKPEEQEQARRIAAGLAPRAVTGAMRFDTFKDAQGRPRPQRNNPTTGQVEIYMDESGQWSPLGQAAEPPSSPAEAGLSSPGYGAADFSNPEQFYAAVGSVIGPHSGRITSTNGGKHNPGSLHPGGGAVDVGMGRETPEQQAAIMAALQAAGYKVRDERSRPQGQREWSGPHLHVERGAPRGTGVGMSTADEAYAKEDATQRARIAYMPRVGEIEAGNAGMKETATVTARMLAERQGKQATARLDAMDSIGLLDGAEELLKRATGGRIGAATDSLLGAFNKTTEGAKATAGLKIISAKLVGKVPRFEGPQSNIDVQLYREAAGDLANDQLPVGQRVAALQTMRQLAQKAAGQQQSQSGSGGGGLSPQEQQELDALRARFGRK